LVVFNMSFFSDDDKIKINQLSKRVDNIVSNAGSSNTEIVDARIDSDGNSHTSLKERLDAKETSVMSSLAEIAYIPVVEEFIATEGQSVFNLATTYTVGKGMTRVEVDEVTQSLTTNYTESSSSSITLTEGVPAGTNVTISLFFNNSTFGSELTDLNTKMTDMETYVYLESSKKQGSETDDSPRIQRALDSFGVNGGILKLTKAVTISNPIQLPENVSLEGTGHGLTNTIITYNGTGFAIKTKGQHTRSNIKNIRLNLNGSNDGILIGDAYANLGGYVPGINQLANISVAGLGVGRYGLKLLNVSHCSMDNVHIGYGSTTGGIGLKIESDTLNTGVISANNCVFGRVDNTDIGLIIDGNAALDSFVFNACYFGGKTATVQLGQSSSGVVRNAVLNGCHYECRNSNGSAIEIYNVRGGGINGGSIQGYGTLVNGIIFKSGTTTRRFNVFGIEANSVLTNFYNNEGATTLEDCILQACIKTGTAVTNQFSGTFTSCQRFDETKFRLDSIVPENIYLGGRKHTYGTVAPTTGTWNQGDVVYNTTPSASGYMGWTCVTSGSPGTWKGFGAIQA
jgi:hypothetical protein